jgi:hypothetical protein
MRSDEPPSKPRSEMRNPMPHLDLQRAFCAWLHEAWPRLAVGVSIARSTSEVTEFAFAIANPVLTGALTNRGDLVVSAGTTICSVLWKSGSTANLPMREPLPSIGRRTVGLHGRR